MGDEPLKRVIVKMSGESLCVPGGEGIDSDRLEAVASELMEACASGVQIGVVIGGGNFARGRDLTSRTDIQSTTADYMGMLATAMNALALKDSLLNKGIDAVVVSAIEMPTVCESYFRPKVLEYLESGKMVIFAAGTGHPGVTTDMCAAIRASELEADILLKATKVDGVYDSDPVENPDAKKYDTLTHEEAVSGKLGVMDISALAFCMDRQIPIMVFSITEPGNLSAAVNGESPGTRVQ
jgi:uridylate kinase